MSRAEVAFGVSLPLTIFLVLVVGLMIEKPWGSWSSKHPSVEKLAVGLMKVVLVVFLLLLAWGIGNEFR